jgi:hypothetical protein
MIQFLTTIVRKIVKMSGIYKSHLYIKYYRSRKGRENIQHLLEKTRKKRFERIYDAKIWMNQPNSRSLSGNGSELENTVNLRAELPKIVSKLKITNLLDVGCGDWNWMSKVMLPCNYIGIDIVDSVIEQNSKNYGASNRSFFVLDAVVDPLPECDAILLREVIFHLSFSDIDRIIKNIFKTNPSYVLITSDPEVEVNNDIVSGDFRMLNLEIKPFNFPKPLIFIDDNNIMNTTRYIGIWKTSDLRAIYNR